MSVRFLRTSTPNTQLSIADAVALTLPDSDWAILFDIVFDGDAQTSGYQTIFRTANSGDAGGLVVAFDPLGSSTSSTRGRIYAQVNGNTSTPRCLTPVIEPGKAYRYLLQRSGGSLFSKLCPILASAPSDGSAVVTSVGLSAAGTAFDGTQGIVIGVHSVTNRKLDQSLARFAVVHKAFTDVEIAQMAYGKEVTAFASPLVYLRLNDVNDLTDMGAMANTVAALGPLATGTAPGYGFNSVPTAPVITGKPVILGSPTPGQASSYTAAPATGNPSPTIAQQWAVDGADVTGATGATFTPSASHDGKQLTVREIAANGQGAPATATSDPVLITSGAVGLDFTEIAAERIFQRIAGAATVPFSGTYVGAAPASIELQLYAPDGMTVVRPWASINATINGDGTWTATPSLLAPTNGLKYRAQMRSKNASGVPLIATVVKANRFGVGENILSGGSSSGAAWFSDKSGVGIIVDQNSTSTNVGGVWQNFGTDGRAGQMAEYLAQRLGVPVGMASVALGGSNLLDWANANSSRWASFRAALADLGGKLGGVFFSAGSNDITNPSLSLTVDAHLALLRAVRDNARADTGQPGLPILWSGINRRLDAQELQANNARTAENIFGDDANSFHTHALDFELSSDGVHLTGEGFRLCCERMRYVWAEAVLGNYRRGPKVTGFSYAGNQVRATLAHRNGTDFTPLTGITGFVVTDDQGTPGIASVVHENANHVLITCDRALVNPKTTYLAGPAPEIGTPVYDNGTMPLPMTVQVALPTTASAGAVNLVGSNCVQQNSCTTANIGGGPKTISLVAAPCSQANSCTTASVGGSGAKTINLVAAPCSQSNVSSSGSVSIPVEEIMSFTPSPSRTLTVSPTSKALTGGLWWNLTTPSKPRGTKDPQATLDVTLNWGPWLADIGNPSIAKFTATIFGVTKVGAYAEGALTTMVFSGGTAAEATITFEIETATTPPLKDERTVYIDLVNQ